MFQAKEDEDREVFGCKELSPDDLKEFEEIDEHFVDSSGFGRKGEPALTPEEFLKKVKKGRYYAITSIGQFQLFVGEYTKLGKKIT